jgi:prevent-host-death family protein
VNIRELKNRLSHYLRLIKAGKSVEITERGKPIGRILPTVLPIEDRLEALAQGGLLLWNKRKLKPITPVARARGKQTVSDLLVEYRC